MKINIKIVLICILIILIIKTAYGIWGGGGGGGGCRGPCGSPGCGQCPCTVRTQGCYGANDQPLVPPVAVSNYLYYLPANKCLGGNCICSYTFGVKEQYDPDESAGACGCIAGTDWNPNTKCCGDDPEDCGSVAAGQLCSIDSNALISSWLPSSVNEGDIRYVRCNRAEFLSDGSTWTKCEGQFWKQSIGGSDYVCIGNGRASLAKCCGDDNSCGQPTDGVRLSTGQSVNTASFTNEPIVIRQRAFGRCEFADVTGKTPCTTGFYASFNITTVNGLKVAGSIVDVSTVNFLMANDLTTNETTINISSFGFVKGILLKNLSIVNGAIVKGFIVIKGTVNDSIANGVMKIVSTGSSNDPNCYCPGNAVKGSFQECAVDDEGNQVCTTKYNCLASNYTKCGGPSNMQCAAGYTCVYNNNITFVEVIQSASSQPNTTYYCTPSKKFVTDLDKDQAGVTASDRQSTCVKAGFTWTGTKCCSEDDDYSEYYNDANGKGGCWNKKPIISISFAPDTNNSVINYNGEFHGCAIDKVNFNKDNDDLLSIPDQRTLEQLITNNDYCFNDPGRNYYCSYTEKWIPTNGADKTHLSFAPISSSDIICAQDVRQCSDGSFVGRNPKDNCNFYPCSSKSKQQADCCAKDECWNGAQCVANQKANPLAQPIGNGFRCIDGQWVTSNEKITSDGSSKGYCPNETQCLVNVAGKNISSQCIGSGQYIDDNYCEIGNWSSRTKLLALKLLKLASGDFTLFCDTRDNTLNNLQYLTSSNELVANVLQNMQTNNFCVMKTGNRIIAATTINKNLEGLPSSNLNLFGITSCNIVDDGQYHSCDSSNKVWYNKRLKSIVYGKEPIQVPTEEEPASFLGDIIKGIIDTIKEWMSSQQPPPSFDDSFLRGIKKFDKLYLAQQGSKMISGSVEGRDFKNAVVQYKGFETDLCGFVEQFNTAKNDVVSSISCIKQGNSYYVLAQGSQFTNINPETIWPDLTSKLRIK